jgi:DNA repair exonuclease SbcCD ATPase subunit
MSTVMQTMELAEISQRLSFLDAERRKDKELIATLLERLETQTNKLEVQSRQIQELERLLASTRAELAKFAQIERSMEQLRQELALLIEANEEKRDKAYRELSRLRQVEQEALTRQIAELRQELKPIPRYDEEIQSLHAEVSRLNGSMTSLQHQLAELDKRGEDRVQSVIYLEEQRRQDNRRITQLETEISSLNKGVNDLADKLPLLEQAIQAKNKEIDRATELVEQQAQMIENQRVSEFRWERQVAEWAKLVEEIKQEAASMATQTVRLHEQHELVRRALDDLEPFRKRIEMRQDELAEMQRLAQDRQKRVMEEWQTEREKERERFRVDNDERWRENARLNERRDALIKAIEEYLSMLSSQIKALWEVLEAWAQSVMIGPREWSATWDKLVKQRPPMAEPPQSVSPLPSQAPKIRPLPSAQAVREEEKGE